MKVRDARIVAAHRGAVALELGRQKLQQRNILEAHSRRRSRLPSLLQAFHLECLILITDATSCSDVVGSFVNWKPIQMSSPGREGTPQYTGDRDEGLLIRSPTCYQSLLLPSAQETDPSSPTQNVSVQVQVMRFGSDSATEPLEGFAAHIAEEFPDPSAKMLIVNSRRRPLPVRRNSFVYTASAPLS